MHDEKMEEAALLVLAGVVIVAVVVLAYAVVALISMFAP